MLVCISDANVLIDVEVGMLMAPMFNLGYQFAVPDVLYWEELAQQHAHWLDLGLLVQSLPAQGVSRVWTLSQKYKHPSRNDLFALALAEQQQCTLLTGDAALRHAAKTEGVEVRGTLWLVREMLRQNRISKPIAAVAFKRMKENARRLPWEEVNKLLGDF